MPYVAYLDEFGHIGPFFGKNHERHGHSPVFGLGGIVLPSDQVRGFGTWFYKRKQDLLAFEIERSKEHPALWEKKGSALYTAVNISKYKELRKFTNRFLNKLENCGGFAIYVGVEKDPESDTYNPKMLYRTILKETIKRLDKEISFRRDSFLMVMDEHQERNGLITEAAIAMYNPDEPRKSLIEPPFQVESHRYQTLQAADWYCGLIGRLGPYWICPEDYPENEIFHKYFHSRIVRISSLGGIRRSKYKPKPQT